MSSAQQIKLTRPATAKGDLAGEFAAGCRNKERRRCCTFAAVLKRDLVFGVHDQRRQPRIRLTRGASPATRSSTMPMAIPGHGLRRSKGVGHRRPFSHAPPRSPSA